MNKSKFMKMKVSSTDTVTVNAVELQDILRENESLKMEVKSTKELNSELSKSNVKLVELVNELEFSLKDRTNEYAKLVKLESNYNKLQKNYNKLVDKLELSNSISKSRKERLNSCELTKGLHVDLRS